MQTLTLDVMAPPFYILEEAQKGSLAVQSAEEAAKSALKLQGNVSCHPGETGSEGGLHRKKKLATISGVSFQSQRFMKALETYNS